MVVSLVGALTSSLLTVFTPIIEVYLLGRFFDGVFFGGYYIHSFIISIEYSRPGETSWQGKVTLTKFYFEEPFMWP